MTTNRDAMLELADMAYPGEDQPHCRRCELPREVCACEDARAYDRAWRHYQRRAVSNQDLQP